jgi:pilus assembly protein Flp/PilA
VQSFTRRFLHDNSGATAIEYGLIIGLISVSLIVGLQSFGNQLVVLYQIVDGYTTSANAKH